MCPIFSLDLEFQAKVSGSCYLVALLDALEKDIKEPREGASSTYMHVVLGSAVQYCHTYQCQSLKTDGMKMVFLNLVLQPLPS